MLIDTHAHLYLNSYEKDRDEVIQRAIDKGIKKIILPNIDSSSINPLHDLCKSFPTICYPLIGLHPTSIKENYMDELAIVDLELDKNRYIGIGEIGIDLYWEKKYFTQQVEAFTHQVRLAIKNHLPVVIHARESLDEIFDVLSDFKNHNLKGIFHAFTGSVEQAGFITKEYNFKLGIGGIVTFKNSGLDRVVQQINIEDIVIETDSPFLTPVPKRGKRNESGYLFYIAEKIAQIHNTSVEKVAEITTKNALEVFNLVTP